MSDIKDNAGNIAQYFTHAQDVDIAREIEDMDAYAILTDAAAHDWHLDGTLDDVADALPLAREIVREWIADRA